MKLWLLVLTKTLFLIVLIIKLTLGNIFMKVKNPPGGATVTKKFKTNLKTHVSPLLIRSQRSKGCQKIAFFFSQMKVFSFCAKILGQSQRTKPQLACLVDPGASFDPPGIPGGASIVEIQEF